MRGSESPRPPQGESIRLRRKRRRGRASRDVDADFAAQAAGAADNRRRFAASPVAGHSPKTSRRCRSRMPRASSRFPRPSRGAPASVLRRLQRRWPMPARPTAAAVMQPASASRPRRKSAAGGDDSPSRTGRRQAAAGDLEENNPALAPRARRRQAALTLPSHYQNGQ